MILNLVSVSDVVNILIDEPLLLLKCTSFYRSLGLDEARFVRLNRKVKTDTIEYVDLFNEILNAWAASNSEDPPTIGKLMSVLTEGQFMNASDRLEVKFGAKTKNDTPEQLQCFLLNLKIGPVLQDSLSVSLPSTTQKPIALIYYKMSKPNKRFKGKDRELLVLQRHFEEYLNSKMMKVVLIDGKRLTGKSELARNFASKSYIEKKASCIWINGNEQSTSIVDSRNSVSHLQAEIHKFMRSALGIANPDLNFLSQAVVGKGCDAWIIIFDGVVESSVKPLKSLLQTFEEFPPGQEPFVIITSRHDKVKAGLSTLSNLTYDTIQLDEILDDVIDLAYIAKSEVTPWVLKKGLASQAICLKVENTFEALMRLEIEIPILRKTSFSLLLLTCFAIGNRVCNGFLFQHWELLLDDESINDTALSCVFDSVLTAGLLFIDSKGIFGQTFSVEMDVKSVVKEYLRHPRFASIIQEVIGVTVEVTEVDILKWLFQHALQLHFHYEFEKYIGGILREVVEHDSLMLHFKKDIGSVDSCLWPFTDLQKMYNNFVRLFGEDDLETLKVGQGLTVQMRTLGMNKEGGEMCRRHYDIMKNIYGKVDSTTVKAGETGADFFEVAGMKTERIEILRDIAVNFENEYTDKYRFTVYKKYNLANALRDVDKEEALRVYKHILPISEDIDMGLYSSLSLQVKQYISNWPNW